MDAGQLAKPAGQVGPTAGKPVTLYGYWRSSASWRVRWAFELKNVAYQYVPVNILKGEHREPAHLKRCPLGQLPVLEFEKQFLSESMAVLNWIESHWPLPPLFSEDVWSRAKTFELCEVINAGTAPLQTPAVQKRHSADSAEQVAWAQHFVERGLNGFAAIRPDKSAKFSVGNSVSAADLYLIPQVYNALRYQVPVKDRMPELFAIYENCLATEACLKASPERQSDSVST